MDEYLIHYNHNHDAFGRFSGSSGSRTRAAKRGLSKLYKLDKKQNNHWRKEYHNYHILESERKTYHHWAGKFSNRKANRYAKKLQKRIGDEPIENLNSKQLYAGRKYCVRFVD